MASLSTDGRGNKTIQFVGPDGKRRSIRLGKVPQKAADTVKGKVETINSANISGYSVDNQTAEWVGTRDAVMYDKLAAVGLVPERAKPEQATLGAFIDGYITSRTDAKPNTVRNLKYSRERLATVRPKMVEFQN